jgi:hypothetical protein
MENLVTETVADQGLTVRVEDETRLVSALPTNRSEEAVLEKQTNNDANAVDAEAPVHEPRLSLPISIACPKSRPPQLSEESARTLSTT